MSTEDTKSPLQSKTLIGLVIAALPDLLTTIETIGEVGIIPPQYAPVVRAVGIALAFIGRWTARLPISL